MVSDRREDTQWEHLPLTIVTRISCRVVIIDSYLYLPTNKSTFPNSNLIYSRLPQACELNFYVKFSLNKNDLLQAYSPEVC